MVSSSAHSQVCLTCYESNGFIVHTSNILRVCVNAYFCLGSPGQKYGSTDVDSLFRLTGTKVGLSMHADTLGNCCRVKMQEYCVYFMNQS